MFGPETDKTLWRFRPHECTMSLHMGQKRALTFKAGRRLHCHPTSNYSLAKIKLLLIIVWSRVLLTDRLLTQTFVTKFSRVPKYEPNVKHLRSKQLIFLSHSASSQVVNSSVEGGLIKYLEKGAKSPEVEDTVTLCSKEGTRSKAHLFMDKHW